MGSSSEISYPLSYAEALNFLYDFGRWGVKLGLANIRILLNLLGNPHKSLRTLHIAGTNGKGSVASFVSSILAQAGFKVGVYTSPHLVSLRERMVIKEGGDISSPESSRCISPQKLVELCTRIREVVQKTFFSPRLSPPTFFEVTTALAFLYFQEEEVDFLICETGMGGRLDATNVLPASVAVLTNIDFDHTDRLGKTLSAIAWEKGGIIKEGAYVVTDSQYPEVLKVIQDICQERGATLFEMGRDFYLKERGGVYQFPPTFSIAGLKGRYEGVQINLLGGYQLSNATISVAACEAFSQKENVDLTEEAIREGLRRACWPGRMEIVEDRVKILLDGAHNPKAARTLKREIKNLFPGKKVVLIFGVLMDKDWKEILRELAPLTSEVIVTRVSNSRAVDPQTVALEAERYYAKVIVADKLPEALSVARRMASPQDLICITGSLYLVGEARSLLVKNP